LGTIRDDTELSLDWRPLESKLLAAEAYEAPRRILYLRFHSGEIGGSGRFPDPAITVTSLSLPNNTRSSSTPNPRASISSATFGINSLRTPPPPLSLPGAGQDGRARTLTDNPNLTPGARQRLEVALVVPAGTVPSGEIGFKTLEGGLYATASVYVPIEEYSAQWDALLGEWLPGSGYQPDHRPALEFYLNNADTDPEGKYRVEICLPVKPL
jgi:hypothetical protein